jgi:predicted nucleotidyltransferase
MRGLQGLGFSVSEVVERVRGVLAGKVTLAFLYGGRVKGYTLKGDYDIAVLMEPTCDLYRLGELAVDIARALGVQEGDVDVKCIDMLPPEHALEALDGVPIVVNSPALAFNLKYRMLVELLDLKEGIDVTLKQLGPKVGYTHTTR